MTKAGVLSLVVMFVSGCDFDPTEIAAKLKNLDSRVSKLENAPPPAPVVSPNPPTPTILWVQDSGYPRASAFFHSKFECSQIAAQWGFPDDKTAKKIGEDPWITSSARKDQLGQQVTLIVSCLPQGVTPYAR